MRSFYLYLLLLCSYSEINAQKQDNTRDNRQNQAQTPCTGLVVFGEFDATIEMNTMLSMPNTTSMTVREIRLTTAAPEKVRNWSAGSTSRSINSGGFESF